MIEKLIDKTLSKNSGNPNERARLIRLAGLAGILANVLFAAVKLAVGLAANSISIISDAVNNLTDALSSVITLIGLAISRRPPDHKHPLGYGRIEYISGMIISALVLVTGVEFLITSVRRIMEPQATGFATAQLIILGVAIIGKWALSRLHLVVGKKTNSESLIAAGTDAKMDVFVSVVTVAAGIVSKLTEWHIDGYVGLVLALFIIYNGLCLIKSTVNSIIGERPDKELAEKLKAEVLKYEPIVGAYDLILHNYGPTTKLGSLNLEIPDYVTVEKAYEAMTAAQQDIHTAHGIFITFGLSSVNTYNKEIVALRNEIEQIVTALPGAISVHNFHYNRKHKTLRFDVVVGFSTTDFSDFRKQAIEAIQEKHPNYAVTIHIDLDYA